jgi:hypothetical protein
MGLDMYLERHVPREPVPDVDGAVVRENSDDYVEVAYWRKSNHIHNWFVNNIQGGVDNCERYPVARDKLQNLIDLCKFVIEHPDEAPSKLPTAAGFFFGSTDYSDWYDDDNSDTVQQLEKVLREYPDDAVFYYLASW